MKRTIDIYECDLCKHQQPILSAFSTSGWVAFQGLGHTQHHICPRCTDQIVRTFNSQLKPSQEDARPAP